MPRPTLEFDFESCGEAAIEIEFLTRYGGTRANWRWLKRKLRPRHSAELRSRCVTVSGRQLLRLGSCYVFGRLQIDDEDAWWLGLVDVSASPADYRKG